MVETLRLGENCLKIGSGATPRGGKDAYLPDGPFSLIRSQNIYNDRFKKDGLAFISDNQARQLENVEVLPRDVLLNITGDSVARVCLVDESVLPARVNQHVAIIRPKPDRIDPLFLRYFLVTPEMQDRMLALASAGATRNALTKAMIENFQIPARDLEEQRIIAQTLGSLDDKIDLNRRMNETLEAMARAIFKDWFVDFGPVRAKAEGRPPYLAPELWALFPDALDDEDKPVGWEEKRVDDILELVYGKALKASDRVDGPIPVYGSGGITGYHSMALVEGPSIIVGRKGTVGSLYWEDGPFFPIDTVFYVKPKTPLTFCFYLLLTLGLDGMNTDAAVPGLNRNNVYRLPVVWSQNELRTEFDRIVNLLRQKMRKNNEESQTLAQLRDLLLPKLMSGEIRLRDAEKAVEQAL